MSDASLSPSDSSLSSCSSPSEASSPTGVIVLSEDLPLPTAPRPFSTKKSHARKQPLGHIPRPRNAFILFRCDYSRQNPRSTKEYDQNDVSRTVGNIWRNMDEEQRAPWVFLAEEEKRKHALLYPGYKYTPRSRRAKPTEKAVQAQIAREGEKVVEAEVKRIAEERVKDMVTVYYPPWATRRTLTYFARRATSCPPPDAVGIEPYSETLDRAMVTTHARALSKLQGDRSDKEKQPPSSTAEGIFVPSAYGIHDEDNLCSPYPPLSWRINADRSLSQSLPAMDPPGGSGSWGGQGPLPPSKYPQSATPLYAFQGVPQRLWLPPFIYTHQGEYEMPQYPYAAPPPGDLGNGSNYENSPELPTLDPPSSPTDTSSSSSLSSPATPPDHSTVHSPVPEYAEYYDPSSGEEVARQESFRDGPAYQADFPSEYGNIIRPSSEGHEADNTRDAEGNIVPRESSMRTTYPPYEGPYTYQ
ncbi:hypothetical protein DFH06DRAFT_721394 [Mycena polygramma]|nr:hypothetical protein DFH06DRAFT_721394 [Mycena polygramma]